MRNPRYKRSEELFNRAIKVIPLASQTFSKSHLAYPKGQAPLFIERAKGSRAWDVDGNEYIDFINGLLPVILGHADPDVDGAVTRQMALGVSPSLATHLEVEVAEMLVDIIPCAEMVRFGKNGSDATAGAIRLARAVTGRERVAACGYHGWQDWYIGSTPRNKGVPRGAQDLIHTFIYNDPESLDKILSKHPGEFACVIMEPMTGQPPEDDFLEIVKSRAHAAGALFILDEIITGFRFALGGAQEKFGVTPDLACFGKGMGNGYPISAVVGSTEIMRHMEDIFFSFTSGGETAGLAAAKATINKLKTESVVHDLWAKGRYLQERLEHLIRITELEDVLSLTGMPPWLLINWHEQESASPWQLKTLFLQEMLARGILVQGAHNLSWSHSKADLDALLIAYGDVLPIIKDAICRGAFSQYLKAPVMEPIFQVRK